MSDRKKLKHLPFVIFIGITIFFALFSIIYLYQWQVNYRNPIRSDGWGYYSYLPAIFDYHDLSFQFSDSEDVAKCIRIDSEGNVINKYPIGTAVLELPFFLIADISCKILQPSLATGYSTPYQCAISLSSLFYFIFGLVLLYHILLKYFSEKIVMWTLVSMVFATNLFHYATYDASFSHIYSFFLVTAFIYMVENVKPGIIRNFFIGFLAGMVLITRNPNVIIVLYYILHSVNDKPSFIAKIKELFKPRTLAVNVLGGIIPVAIQCGYWLAASGKLFIRSYGEEEYFVWLFPYLINVLFSVSKGCFFYAPVLGIAFCGLWVVKKLNKGISFYSILVVILLDIYITSSWYCWGYAGSFGQRPFVDFYSLFAILLACSYDYLNSLCLQGSNGYTRTSVFNLLMRPLLILMILVSTRLMLAYWHEILPFDMSTMADVMNALSWNFEEMRNVICEHISWLQ